MEELKCKECGEILSYNSVVCPKCGCPVSNPKDENKNENTPNSHSTKFENINIRQILSLIIGVIVIAIGISVMLHQSEAKIYSANLYDVESAIFGGDFYTEIYAASDTIVDELNDINNGIEIISAELASVINTIYYASGMIIITVGLAIIANSIRNIREH